MISSDDRREHRRLDRKVVLKVVPKDGPEKVAEEWTIVTSKNISAGGVMFTYDRKLAQGTPLTFRIHFPERTIDCTGVVYRSNPSSLQPLVNVAAKLENLCRGDREFIERYQAA